ncbi:hypothetical protein FRC0088_01831 [Corynebacterium diphtheriae]|nr:hypothetical protein FRC0088_01831 [Corynebacterium diphtheriae]
MPITLLGYGSLGVSKGCASLTCGDASPESEVIEMAKSGSGKSHRSAITGRFVKASTAARHPKTTVSESRSRKSK